MHAPVFFQICRCKKNTAGSGGIYFLLFICDHDLWPAFTRDIFSQIRARSGVAASAFLVAVFLKIGISTWHIFGGGLDFRMTRFASKSSSASLCACRLKVALGRFSVKFGARSRSIITEIF